MIPENNMSSLARHLNYTVEKEAFLNSLSDEDLLFIRNIICGATAQSSKTDEQSNQLHAKKIEQSLEKFEHPTVLTKTKDYLSSWIWSPPKSTIFGSAKAKIIESICSNFATSYLPSETSKAVLGFETEIGMYEMIYKEPPLGTKAHDTWQTGQDNYWRQIAYAVGYDLPDPLPETKSDGAKELRKPTVAEHVKQYLKDYKTNILKEERAVYIRAGENMSPIVIPVHIKAILKNRPTIQGLLEVKQWKNDIDKRKIQWILEQDFRMLESNKASTRKAGITDKQIADGFDKHLEFFINKGHFYLIGGTPLDLSGLNLSSIPESITRIPGIKEIKLDNNQLTALPESFGNFTELTKLGLSHNQIVGFPASMQQLQSLKELVIQSNSRPISADFISQLSTLEFLKLGRTHTKASLDFSNLNNLQVLELRYVKDLDFVEYLPRLVALIIETNELESLPDFTGKLKNLNFLKITDGTLKDISTIGSLLSLKSLRLERNQIDKIPEGIGLLKNLDYFNIYDNQVEVIPESIGDLKSLIEINLSGNKIEFLPNSIGNLNALKKLDLSFNHIKVVPESIGNLRSLKILELSTNQITVFPAWIDRLESLSVFLIGNNEIRVIPTDIRIPDSLLKLLLDDNPIAERPATIGMLRPSEKLLYVRR